MNRLITYRVEMIRFLAMRKMVFFTMVVIMGGCTGLGKISEGEYLLTKNSVALVDKKQVVQYKKIKAELEKRLKPKPNGRLLWMRPGPAIYNTVSEPKKERGFKYWLKYKVGRQPVLVDEEICRNVNRTLENYMYHKGYFNARSDYFIDKQRKTAKVIWTVRPGTVYRIDTLIFPEVTDTLTERLNIVRQGTLLSKGIPYSLDLLKSERKRIEEELRNQGFYYFDETFIYFKADTTGGDHTVKLKVTVKHDTPQEAGQIYTIGHSWIAEDYSLENYHPDTITTDKYSILATSDFMRTKILLNTILLEKGDPYSEEKRSNTLRQLMGLRSYKFVNARFVPSDKDTRKLEGIYMLTPHKKMSLSAELNAVSKSNNFVGPGLRLSFQSRNFFRGAELFSLNVTGRYEQQISGEKKGDVTYEIGVDAKLDIPRKIPFKLKKKNKPYLPYTNIILGMGIFSRVSLYKFNTFTMQYGYTWQKSEFLMHSLRPMDISVTDLVDVTDDFREFLQENPSIRKSFEEQFIMGLSYSFVLNKLANTNKPQYYVGVRVDPSGNLVGVIGGWLSDNNPGDQVKIFGSPVSQFVRVRTDIRYYFKTGKESRIATRLLAGIGVPYGNSTVMPYIKQFYAGGTNSIRAFRARSLGPGTYAPPDSLKSVLVDQTGDIKLEGNIEFRFPIIKYLKGAFFVDAGNIWLVNADTLRPGSQFKFSRFINELGMGAGFGLRLDFDLMVLRVDVAIPIRKPWLPEGERWVFKDINFADSRWRRDNLMWNISIGYPF